MPEIYYNYKIIKRSLMKLKKNSFLWTKMLVNHKYYVIIIALYIKVLKILQIISFII